MGVEARLTLHASPEWSGIRIWGLEPMSCSGFWLVLLLQLLTVLLPAVLYQDSLLLAF